jgi:hypothetical protein
VSAVEDILSIIEGEEWIVIMTLVTRTAKAVQRHGSPWKQPTVLSKITSLQKEGLRLRGLWCGKSRLLRIDHIASRASRGPSKSHMVTWSSDHFMLHHLITVPPRRGKSELDATHNPHRSGDYYQSLMVGSPSHSIFRETGLT